MNKRFTDIFIKRPVLATVISLMIFLLGLRALFDLPVRQFPKVTNTKITITTAYPGASADLISGFITSPIEKSVASADGIDYMTSQSSQGTSAISIYLKQGYDPEKAYTNILSKVNEVKYLLPRSAQDPVVSKDTSRGTSLMYISFNSTKMSPEQITDYLTRVVQPKLESVQGVSQAQILGPKQFAMRIWLNPKKLRAFHVTASDVNTAIENNNFLSAPGNLDNHYKVIGIDTNASLNTVQDFENIVIKANGNQKVTVGDVAKVLLAAQSYDYNISFNGKSAVFIGINSTPEANPLTVIDNINQVFPTIVQKFPAGLHGQIVYDATKYIRESIHEVIQTIAEAAIIVIIVILCFLGSIRAVLVPFVTIPLSLVGSAFLMSWLGYSINLLTLLAMVLAIGMVVDDAIVVLENIHRHIEQGMSKVEAALQGALEIAMPVISMTLTLAAVYAPIGFMDGMTGQLFRQFAFSLAATVVLSGVIALTLSPMMCSKVLPNANSEGRFEKAVERTFERIKNFYQRRLTSILETPSVIVLFAVVVLSSCFFLYTGAKQQLAPTEDQSVIFGMATAPVYANIDYMSAFTKEFDQVFDKTPQIQDYFILDGIQGENSAIFGAILKPWGDRKLSQSAVLKQLTAKLANVAGLNTVAFPLPSLPANGNLAVNFVLTSTLDFKALKPYADTIMRAAQKSGLFVYIANDLKFKKPEVMVDINHQKAQQLGISAASIANTLAAAYGGNYINLFSMASRGYQVIPMLQRNFRADPSEIGQLEVRSSSGALIPLSTVVTIKHEVEPSTLNHFQQLNAVTFEGALAPGHTSGEAVQFFQQEAAKVLPKSVSYDYGGQMRSFVTEGDALLVTFFFALIIIYLVLSAQFESFRDPLIILISVPMSICGALIPLYLGLATVNIYTQIGLVTLIGLISKHGILMTEFANKLQEQGASVKEAIIKAATIRLRAILMTTAAMVFGVVPLLMASGAGAHSRFDIGLVIACGMLIGTIFTLFVVPTMYLLLAKRID